MKFDVVIIGGGKAGVLAGVTLQRAGKSCCIVSAGESLHQVSRQEFIALGGTFLAGDTVVAGEFVQAGDNTTAKLGSVCTQKLGETQLRADSFILATGKFFSKGLVASMTHIYEPIFGLDVQYDKDPAQWVAASFSQSQPFMSYGVLTDEKGRVSINGKIIDNLYAAGEILAGDVDIEKTALDVCRNII